MSYLELDIIIGDQDQGSDITIAEFNFNYVDSKTRNNLASVVFKHKALNYA